MRPIARQTDGNRPNSGNRSFSDQNRGFHPQTRTSRDYSRIKCFSCGQFGHMRTCCPQPEHPYCSNLRVGNSSPIIVNNGRAIINRETPHRPGPHTGLHSLHLNPTPSSCIKSNSSQSPPDTSINSIHLQPSSCTETCLSTADQDHVRLQDVPAKDVTERTPVPQKAHRNTSSDQNGIVPVMHPVNRSVNWSQSVDDHPREEAVMQISGAGHWFLEGWIGDHAVNFLVDSGSAVTAVSSSFYKNLRGAGAPVGEIRPTNRRLRGANGSQIDILRCSFCMVSF